FSDLEFAPKTGWEGSGTKGAAVTIWGKNFGSTQGSSYVTVNGARITEYAEWGATGTASGIARGLERITFWLNNNCQDGNGTITVTVNGVISNALPFTVSPAKIYFVSVSTGNNSCNGLYATPQGGNCPFRDIKMFNPGLNPSRDNESTIVYVRGGTYTELDVDSAFVALRGPYGASNKRHSLIAYPAEIPALNAANAGRGVIWNANYSPYGRNSYFTYSKLKIIGGPDAINSWGDYNRVIGNHFKDMLQSAWSGVVMVDNSQYTKVYGNYFDHNGYDSYKHNIYIKTHANYISGDKSAEYTDVGWNEFNDAYASDTHGGVIFVSKASDASGKYTRYIWIHDNYFHDGNMEFIYTGDNTDISDIYIYNNIFQHGTCPNAGIFLAWHTRSVYVYNNTLYQIGASNAPMVGVTGATTAVFKNNIFYSRPGQQFLSVETYQGATFSSDSDLYYNPGGSASGNPLFVNPQIYDFHLQSTSPAINAGTSAVSSVVTYDYEGIPRPQGLSYDVGAYEY
ncbi:MAG: hypothetical protein OEW69_06360, partial [Nitrospirota bacterium]|nr:hypothetical protein [Nitrospirota bacterium]